MRYLTGLTVLALFLALFVCVIPLHSEEMEKEEAPSVDEEAIQFRYNLEKGAKYLLEIMVNTHFKFRVISVDEGIDE